MGIKKGTGFTWVFIRSLSGADHTECGAAQIDWR
jgi:hypothetical protein